MTFAMPWRDAPAPTLAPGERVLAESPRPPTNAWLGAGMLLLAVAAQRFVPGIRAVWVWILAGFLATRLVLQLTTEADWTLTDRRLVRTGVFGTRSWAWTEVPTARAVRTVRGTTVVFEDANGRRIGAVRTTDPERLLRIHANGRDGRRVHPSSSP